MPDNTTGKLIPVAAIVIVAITLLAPRQAGSAPEMVNGRQPIVAPTVLQPICRAPAVRICRPVHGRRTAYLEQTPIPAGFRVN